MTSASVQYVANIGVVKRIDVVRSHRRGHNFSMTMIRLSGSQLHAARVLVGLSLDELADRAKLCRHSIRKWETSSDAVPGAMYPHLCRALDVLEGEGGRFSGDGVSALSGDSPDYLVEAVPAPSTPNDSKGLHLGMDLAARVRHAGICHASMSRSPDLRRSYDGALLGCQLTAWGVSTASQDADR